MTKIDPYERKNGKSDEKFRERMGEIKCSKCGSEMKQFKTQIQSRSGYETDIELIDFRCSNIECNHTEIIKREVFPTNPLSIENADGSMEKIR